MKQLLIDLNISTEDSIRPYYPQVRDNEDISVLKCEKSGVIFLSDTKHMDISHYENKDSFEYWQTDDRQIAVSKFREDIHRRKKILEYVVHNSKWMDVGTGNGGLLDELKHSVKELVAVEPQQMVKQNLQNLGYTAYSAIDDVLENEFDIVTLFHVLEHIVEPIDALKVAHSKMKEGGKIYVEVPHANDFLISNLNSESFKKFTFWSEHLILHTRESLTAFLKESGFRDINITGCQRHPLANHLYWLSKNEPGGHKKWDYLRTNALDESYEQMLQSLDKTDTLIATAVK
jgi:2-polyprenyl-3-methyl-5-hydroxy-6-metoxy-1,4-benzoquinol methylase